MRFIEIRLLLVLVVALLAGCGGGGATPAATSAASQPSPPAAAGQPSATKVAEVSQPTAAASTSVATPEPAAEEEALDLEDRENGLKNLKSYRATWSYSWTGKKDGQDQTVKWLTTQAYTAEPAASHIRMEASDSLDPDQSGAFEMIQIGQNAYLISTENGKQQCTPFSSADSMPLDNLGPGSFGSIRGGKYVGQETINGIRTKHYRYDEKATGLSTFSRLSGDVWVAVDGGYAVKDVADWEGRLFGATDDTTEEGKGSWTWELTEANKSFEIAAPPGCESSAEGLPMMADATEQSTFGDMLSYKTKSEMADAVKFYQAEMPKAGWTAEGEAVVSDQFASLNYTKDGKKASIMLSPDNEQVSVLITVEK